MPAMFCYNCKDSIISNQHYKSCNTVNMDSVKTLTFEELKNKPLMTYGLGGCTAFIIVNEFTVTLGHSSPLSNSKMIKLLEQHMNTAKHIYVKMPTNYVQQPDGMYKHEDDPMFKFLDNSKCKVVKEVYSTGRYDNKFMTTLYVVHDDICDKKIKYSDIYGRWLTVNLDTTSLNDNNMFTIPKIAIV
jgi:hypothetical protein